MRSFSLPSVPAADERLQPVMPEVSVVIPTCNRPELVVRAVESVLRQTEQAFEIIVVVDGGDPVTCRRLQRIDDPRLSVVRVPTRQGAAGARNLGVSHTKAAWVAFLDDDDEMVPERLALQLAVARASRGRYPVVGSRCLVRTGRGNYVLPELLPEPSQHLSEYLFCRRGFSGRIGSLGTSSILVRAELLRRLPIPDLPRHEDWAWVLEASRIDGFELHVLPGQLTICHEDPAVPSLTRPKGRHDWQFTYRWARQYRPAMTPSAYASFLLGPVARMARDDGDRSAALRLLTDAFRQGRPYLNHLALFAAIWLLPRQLRQGWVALIRRSTVSAGAVGSGT